MNAYQLAKLSELAHLEIGTVGCHLFHRIVIAHQTVVSQGSVDGWKHLLGMLKLDFINVGEIDDLVLFNQPS